MQNLYEISKSALLILILIGSYFIFSYNYFNGWWYSSIGSVLIVLISFFIFKSEFLRAAGLKIGLKTVTGILIFTLIIYISSLALVEYASERNSIEVLSIEGWSHIYHTAFYTLNEEIMLGSAVLYILIDRLKIQPLVSSVLLAFCFSLLHFAVYKWIFSQKGVLLPTALMTLFFAGILRNNLIIHTGHIGYSWALHFGWVSVMFGKSLQYKGEWTEISEPERLNVFLGSAELVLITALLAGFSSVYLLKILCFEKKLTGRLNHFK